MNPLESYIEHTLLRAGTTPGEVTALAGEALAHGFPAICVNPSHVRGAALRLGGTGVKVVTVVGFPLGLTYTEVKVYEAMMAALDGADELDVVINTGAAVSGDWTAVLEDLRAVVTATEGIVHKAIIETACLTQQQKRQACLTALEAGADFIKTSTGMGHAGATAEDVRLIRDVVGGRAGIKAAGGIGTREQAIEMIEAGADRIGTSSGLSIIGQ